MRAATIKGRLLIGSIKITHQENTHQVRNKYAPEEMIKYAPRKLNVYIFLIKYAPRKLQFFIFWNKIRTKQFLKHFTCKWESESFFTLVTLTIFFVKSEIVVKRMCTQIYSKIFREINSSVTSLVKWLLSHNFCCNSSWEILFFLLDRCQ